MPEIDVLGVPVPDEGADSARLPTAVAASTPDWSRLRVSPDWTLMWRSPHSVVHQEVERLEQRLHNVRITDHLDIIETRARLAALKWLVDVVETQADNQSANTNTNANANANANANTTARRLTRLFDRVLPPRSPAPPRSTRSPLT